MGRSANSSSQERLGLSVLLFFIFLDPSKHDRCVVQLGLQLLGFLLQLLDLRPLSCQDLATLPGILLKLACRVQGVALRVPARVSLFGLLVYYTFRAFHLKPSLNTILGLFLRLFVFVSKYIT